MTPQPRPLGVRAPAVPSSTRRTTSTCKDANRHGCHRRHLRDRCTGPVHRDHGGGRSVGVVVRAVPDPRPDPREGRRRDRRGGAGQGGRGRQPAHGGDVPGAVHPGRLRHPGPQGGGQLHRSAARAGRAPVGRRAEPAPRPKWTGLSRPGDEQSLRRAVELEPANERAVLGLAPCWSTGATSADRQEALALLARMPGDRRPPGTWPPRPA